MSRIIEGLSCYTERKRKKKKRNIFSQHFCQITFLLGIIYVWHVNLSLLDYRWNFHIFPYLLEMQFSRQLTYTLEIWIVKLFIRLRTDLPKMVLFSSFTTCGLRQPKFCYYTNSDIQCSDGELRERKNATTDCTLAKLIIEAWINMGFGRISFWPKIILKKELYISAQKFITNIFA